MNTSDTQPNGDTESAATYSSIALAEQHRSQIVKKGYTFQRAFHTENTGVARNYTIGLSMNWNWPELVLLGTIDADSANNILRTVIYKWQDTGMPVMDDIVIDQGGAPWTIRLKLLSGPVGRLHTALVTNFTDNENYSVVQVLWSDANGNLPDSLLYDTSPSLIQPILEKM